MKTIRYYLKIYFMLTTQYIKSRMQYRLDVFAGSGALVISHVIVVFTFWALIGSVSSIKGWSLDELIFLYSFALLATSPLDLFFNRVWELDTCLQNGSFIKYYFRPLNIMFYFMSELFDIKGLSNLLFGVCAFVYSTIRLGLFWSPYKLLMLLLLLAGSSLIMVSLMVIAASTAFWFIFAFPMLKLTSSFRDFSRYPVTIFNPFFRFIFTYILPIGFIAYYPSQLFLRPQSLTALAFLSPLAGTLLFVLACAVWSRGVRKYTGTGS